MRKAFSKLFIQHTALALGACVSLALLAIFLLFQYFDSNVLKLESRWLLLSGAPLLAALIVGGYIKSFKGFGVELEASLSKPVANVELAATEAMAEIFGDEKRSISYLHRLSARDRRTISRLVLIQGRVEYYQPYALEMYLQELRGLKYFEVRTSAGQFIALIPVAEFRHGNEVNANLLGELIHFLEQSQVLERFAASAITTQINEETGVIEALKLMRRHRVQQLVVVDEQGVFQGLLTARAVERRIVDNVLHAQENA